MKEARMSTNRTTFHVLMGAMLALMISSCQVETLTPTSPVTYETQDAYASFICFTSLDRTLPADLDHSATSFGTDTLAGYVTYYYPGSPPFPCDRLSRAVGYGQFQFDLSQLTEPRTSLVNAVLQLASFTPSPAGSVNVVFQRMWGDDTSGILGAGSVGHRCAFKVQLVTSIPSGMWYASPPITRNLTTGADTFVVSNSGGHASISVTPEISRQLSGAMPNNGFIVVPTSTDSNPMLSNSRCLGAFTFRLVLVFNT
jgi:hypothetical protein